MLDFQAFLCIIIVRRGRRDGGKNGFGILVPVCLSSRQTTTHSFTTTMRFLSSVALGVVLLTLWIAMPRVFNALEEVLLALLSALQGAFQQAGTFVASPAALTVPVVAH